MLGTRPEAVKLFPVIRTLQGDDRFDVSVVTTGQHREMVAQILTPFGIELLEDLDIMRLDQTLTDIVTGVMPRLDDVYSRVEPDIVIVQGDTTSAFAAGLSAFHRRIRVAHLEAGLRSFDRFHPYPEESNRRMLSAVTDLHLAPTAPSAENLLREGVNRDEIVITGNTTIDSLLITLNTPDVQRDDGLPRLRDAHRLVLVTLHRRESWSVEPGADGDQELPLEAILRSIAQVARQYCDVDFVYPVHRNPRVREPAEKILGGLDNVLLEEPLDYIPFVRLMARASVILTDSGGIQEEAPSLGVPVLVARRTTERPEGLQFGSSELVGTDPEAIEAALVKHLSAPPRPQHALGEGSRPNPFGDGKAGERVAEALLYSLGFGDRPAEFAGLASFEKSL